jgi:hypothetical protein
MIASTRQHPDEYVDRLVGMFHEVVERECS